MRLSDWTADALVLVGIVWSTFARLQIASIKAYEGELGYQVWISEGNFEIKRPVWLRSHRHWPQAIRVGTQSIDEAPGQMIARD
jgi:hypothetical protein